MRNPTWHELGHIWTMNMLVELGNKNLSYGIEKSRNKVQRYKQIGIIRYIFQGIQSLLISSVCIISNHYFIDIATKSALPTANHLVLSWGLQSWCKWKTETGLTISWRGFYYLITWLLHVRCQYEQHHDASHMHNTRLREWWCNPRCNAITKGAMPIWDDTIYEWNGYDMVHPTWWYT